MIFIKYADKIAQAYAEIKAGKYNKSIIENNDARIVIYKCGIIIRIDIKEADNGTC
jgi:hypothetical protein